MFELLEYLKSLQPQNLQESTTNAGEDALEAMNTFIQRLLEGSNGDNSSRIGKAFVLVHGGGLQHPQH
ncbi:hypothetical protein BDL97_14G031800 [Sphagnum fallax]|nr:hypothetical protein BDL97_14G031800 [Sphagnum fallax]